MAVGEGVLVWVCSGIGGSRRVREENGRRERDMIGTGETNASMIYAGADDCGRFVGDNIEERRGRF